MKKVKFLSVLLLLFSVLVTGAQDENADETHPLYEMLALVPVTPEVIEDLIGYTDIRAIEASRGIETPESYVVAREDEESLWFPVAMRSIFVGPELLSQSSRGADIWQETVGFDFVDIRQIAYFGRPPATGTILKGDFDPAMMTEALSGLEIEVAEETDAYTLWCWTEGCDKGTNIDFEVINNSNPFGGHLGRREPLAYLPSGILANSADEQTVRFMLNLQAAGTGHVLTLPAYRAVADYVTGQEDALLRQMLFAGNRMTSLSDPAALLFGDEEMVAMLKERFAQYGTLPLYELVAMADMAYTEAGTEQAQVILVYGDEDTAQAALEELEVRLAIAPSVQFKQGFMEVVTARNATLLPLDIINDEANGRALLVISFEGDMPSNEENEDGFIVASSRMFSALVQGLYNRDLTWLIETMLIPE